MSFAFAKNLGELQHIHSCFYDEIFSTLLALQMDKSVYISNHSEAMNLSEKLAEMICRYLLDHDYIQLATDRTRAPEKPAYVDYAQLLAKYEEES